MARPIFYHSAPFDTAEFFSVSLELFICDSAYTFHPKIYAMALNQGAVVLVGSANLTQGGFQDNFEASAHIDDPSGELMNAVRSYIDGLIAGGELVPATEERIREYERSYLINRVEQDLAKRRANRAAKRAAAASAAIDTEILRDILLEITRDTSEQGFESQQKLRQGNRLEAARIIKELAAMKPLDSAGFVPHYEALINFFHSGGLHRAKSVIAKRAAGFQRALGSIIGAEITTPAQAYQTLLGEFQHIPRAGVNVMTEILHALDNKRFAIMNQNAVAGLRLASINEFPEKPTKRTVRAEDYARFCERAGLVKADLQLEDYTAVDALFNYAYWEYEGGN